MLWLFLILQIQSLQPKLLVIDLNNFEWRAYQNGQLIRSGFALGGQRSCPEFSRSCKTPQGHWKILFKARYIRHSSRYPVECNNKRICGAKMFWFSQFHPEGIGIHGATSDKLPRKHASHGCVRTTIEDAKWLNREFLEIGTLIEILPYNPGV